ncbi:MAG: hypothetical protein LBT49_07010 [Prevotellaceae bacterium]|jgi:hypothetical protein|nr:hypothetical protein [Prevotellaceae bacterium]
MAYPNYIPRPLRQFLSWILNLIAYIANGGLSRFDIPDAEFNDLRAKAADFEAKFKTADAPDTRTKASVQAMNDARTPAEKAVRLFVRRFLNDNPKVSNADRDNMGLPIYKTTRTRVPAPTEKPDFSIVVHSGGRIQIRFHAHDEDKGTRNAKPFGVHGVEIAWAILDAPPTSYADLIRSAFATRSPYAFQFDLSDAGKRFYCCLRWENTRGEKGPWSEIQSVVIA